MNEKILKHYSEFGIFTNPGCYLNILKDKLPDDIQKIGFLVRKSVIHRTTLEDGNTGTNADMKYGDMTKVSWWRQCEDDYLPTASAMIAELYRRDSKGFTSNRSAENKIVVTCRFVSILMAAILKSKGIPARVRSGFFPELTELYGDRSVDHWINQYWNQKQKHWITIDVDCSLAKLDYDPYDVPYEKFDWSADSWLAVREGKIDGKHFWNAGGFEGLMVVAWELFYDFHSLMNNEIIYLHGPAYMSDRFEQLTKRELEEIDGLARLMRNPDKNFDALQNIWETNKKFRILKGALL
ncbi:MAG: transglutaminase domain-containing protein [Candidatus Doudnabacteria bacterium]